MKIQPYYVDYHTHNYRCGHAVGEMREYIEQAIAIGFHEIGLSDHLPLFHIPNERKLPQITMEQAELDDYVEEACKLKNEYKGQIAVKVGIEADYVPGWEEYLERELQRYPYDYVLGSVHFIGEWDHSDSRCVNQWEGKNIADVYREYYSLIQAAAESKLFDSMAHVDVIKRYKHRPQEDISDFVQQTFQAIKNSGICVEVNTSGEFMPVQEIFPAKDILVLCQQLGIPLTVGSDSHSPSRVGTNIKRMYSELHEMGFAELMGFEERKRYPILIKE
jgi:histidinol-phosphatase (PHP family)